MGIAGFTYGTGGNITIDNKGNVTSGTGGAGGSDGIKASANSGDSTITITNSGNIDTTSGGDKSVGIEAVNGPGFNGSNLNIAVTNSGDITTGAESVGIKAASTGANGMVTVDNSGAIETGASVSNSGGSTGIFADVNGDNSLAKVTNNGAITTSGTTAAGISAIANYYGVSSGNVIVPTNNGSVVVDNKAGGTITTTGSDAFGIFAQAGSFNPVGQGPNADNGGTVTVTNAATIHSGGKSIGAYTYGSDGTVTITNSGNLNSTNEEGIYAKSNGDNSNVTVTNSASVNAYGGAAGLVAYTSGGDSNIVITNTKTSSLYGVGFGVIAETTGSASTITVTTDGSVYGELGGIKVNSTGGATVNVGTSGYVGADNFLAVKSTVGTVEINDSGMIAGRVELSDAGNVMNINDSGTFRAFTNSNFGAGNDTLNNAGIVNASGSYFGSSPSTVTLTGLENFVNGSLGSGPGLTTMIDGVVGDKLTTPGDFTGRGNSKLGVDTDFSNDTSDTLTIGGNSYGQTNLVVHVTAIAPGVPTATFIPVVTVTGTTSDSNFGISAPVNAGLFAYDLFRQGNQHGLRYVGLGNAAFELPAGITGAQDVWQDTTGFWQDRMADLRTEASGTHDADLPGENLGPRMSGIWGRASGDWSSRDGDVSYTDPVSQQTETLNLDRRQRTDAFLGGVDMGMEGLAGGDMLFGVMGGYVASNLDFKATGDSWNYKGGTVGAYATYLNGGFYLDGLVKADFLNVDINDSQGAINGKASTNATNIGARLDAGYRVAMGWGFIEPQASLEWVHTTMDSVSIFGGNVGFQNGDSGRARIGVRIGTDMQMNGMTVSPDLTLSVWNHFGSDNAVNIDFPGNAFSATDSAGNGTFGEVGVGVNIASSRNWSGVVRGSVRFGDHYSAGSVGAAVRYGW